MEGAPASGNATSSATPEDRKAVQQRLHEVEREIRELKEEGADYKLRSAKEYYIDPSHLTDRDQELVRTYEAKQSELSALKEKRRTLPKRNPLRSIRNFLFGL